MCIYLICTMLGSVVLDEFCPGLGWAGLPALCPQGGGGRDPVTNWPVGCAGVCGGVGTWLWLLGGGSEGDAELLVLGCCERFQKTHLSHGCFM